MNNMKQGKPRCYTEFSGLEQEKYRGSYMFHYPILDYSGLTYGFECANIQKNHEGVSMDRIPPDLMDKSSGFLQIFPSQSMECRDPAMAIPLWSGLSHS